ncbi:hypothetical protein C8R44DRAFT_981281 [Mycena epipterygia]|nr:hypothetical protein C8R44DRAFT_981281 [Mycena epipterygia]
MGFADLWGFDLHALEKLQQPTGSPPSAWYSSPNRFQVSAAPPPSQRVEAHETPTPPSSRCPRPRPRHFAPFEAALIYLPAPAPRCCHPRRPTRAFLRSKAGPPSPPTRASAVCRRRDNHSPTSPFDSGHHGQPAIKPPMALQQRLSCARPAIDVVGANCSPVLLRKCPSSTSSFIECLTPEDAF